MDAWSLQAFGQMIPDEYIGCQVVASFWVNCGIPAHSHCCSMSQAKPEDTWSYAYPSDTDIVCSSIEHDAAVTLRQGAMSDKHKLGKMAPGSQQG